MGYHYEIDRFSDIWMIFGYGYANGEGYLEILQKSASHPDFHWDIDLLLDFSYITELDIDLEMIRQVLAQDKEMHEKQAYKEYRIAALTRNFIDQSIVELYKEMSKSVAVSFQSFKHLKDALAWLGKEEAFERINKIRTGLIDAIQ